MSEFPSYLVELHKALDSRLRPEDVLAIIARGRPSALPAELRRGIRQAGSKSGAKWYSLMSSDFHRPVDATNQLSSAAKAFGHPVQHTHTDPGQVTDLREVINDLAKEVGGNGCKLTKEQRKAAGIDLSGRKYRRQWRAMRRLHYKTARLAVEQRKRALTIIGHSGFITDISLERFAADPNAAHFIAYYIARKNLRRQFSLEGKENPIDTVAQWLLRTCVDAKGTDWPMIAWVYPNIGILKKLTDEQVGELLGKWYNVMAETSMEMRTVWSDETDKWTMVVQRGDDSSTWNTLATAYNMARSSWLACIAALGAGWMLSACCPGKAMRLMAGDLVRWHGGEVDANTKVWAWLPFPWEVIHGDERGWTRCSRATVERACEAAGLDPQDTGWTAPRPSGTVVPFSCTPELVHGVTVASPEWAALLRRAGVFSGKKITQDEGLREAAVHGLVEGVVTSPLPDVRPVE